MIPILYRSSETAFDTNGIGALVDAAECRVRQSLNGIPELTMRYPAKGVHYQHLTKRAIIMAKSDPVKDPQPFRIYHRASSSNGYVTVRARHIAYDLNGCAVTPFSATGAPAALAALKANSVTDCPFDFWTDKTAAATMTVRKPATIWSLLGGTKGSVLDCFGGEYEFDRFTVKLWSRRGSDQGVSIRYGKNLASLEQDENCANCYTSIFPFWVSSDEASAETVLLPERIVKAAGEYDHERTLPVDFSYEWSEAPTEEMLRVRAEKYINDNNIGVPDVSLRVQHVSLDQTAEYAGKIPLERVLLGDTVEVLFPEMNVSANTRIVETDYDVLADCYVSTTIGSVKSNLATTIAQQNKESQKKPDVGMVQMIAARLAAAIIGAHGGATRMLDTNGDSMPDEIYIADSYDPVKAVKVWRFNYEGWAGSENGYNGPFILGATFEDGILAHMVKAANLIAGTIVSADGGSTFFLDLNNGVLRGNFSELLINNESVGVSLSKLSLLADSLQLEVQDLQADITKHFRFGADGLTISNSATGMGIGISEQRVIFTGGQDPTTVITPNAMETTNLTVGIRLDLGSFSWIPRTNNNLSLRWMGG